MNSACSISFISTIVGVSPSSVPTPVTAPGLGRGIARGCWPLSPEPGRRWRGGGDRPERGPESAEHGFTVEQAFLKWNLP
ncbi:hypothetical protein NDU88_000821 [Pleurodeles waltl]|uniref:Uncharacterized protein n=1 Tax=Pleurodeles waltl TaxID=8319 RepID=A0AAV7KR86_PLEWA|nr:hypothetical protein NDU88_000821 [Pleurodeles waltl]